jgi:hypothetical protein
MAWVSVTWTGARYSRPATVIVWGLSEDDARRCMVATTAITTSTTPTAAAAQLHLRRRVADSGTLATSVTAIA